MDRGRESDLVCLALCIVLASVPHGMAVCESERHGLDGWSTVWIKQMRCSSAVQPSGVFLVVLLCCWPKAGSAVAWGVLQAAARAGAIEKGGRGLFGAGLCVGVEWRRLCPGAKSGSSARERRGSGKCFVVGLYFQWHQEEKK